MVTYLEFIRAAAPGRNELDVFLDPRAPGMAKFDPELGYILGNNLVHDGLDGCATLQTVDARGARAGAPYPGVPCRVNTYGDSFTQCAQVSDGETWQAYLSGHLGEPIANWGVGGYGAYQAWRRQRRTELSADGAPYVLLYYWGDDHYRSLLRCRHALTYKWWDSRGGHAFHGNYWRHLEMDLDSGSLVEADNPLAAPEALYRMGDPDYFAESLRDDLMLQLSVFLAGQCGDIDLLQMARLADRLALPDPRLPDPDARHAALVRLRDAYALAAAKWVTEAALTFCKQHGKQLLFLLLDIQVTRALLHGQPRPDQTVLAYLQERGVNLFDMNLVHLADFRQFNLDPDAYLKRYLIGHYNPAGNHLFAYALAPVLTAMLEPKPAAYQ
ncbi:MAG: hypothetical protein ACYC6L_01550 [Anaerolineae bacterium]